MVTIAVVDDYPAIADSFKRTIGYAAEERGYSDLVHTEVFNDAKSIMARLLDTGKPRIDVVVTDICLNGDIQSDKEGIRIARFARNAFGDIKIVAYSGRVAVDELEPEESNLFSLKFQKGGTVGALRERGERIIDLAFSGSGFSTFSVSGTKREDAFWFPYDDEDFLSRGYKKIEMTCKAYDHFLPTPFTVWKKDSDDGVELEVQGVPRLFSFGDESPDAEEALMILINEYASFTDDEVNASPKEIREACVFAREVTGRMMVGKAVQ